MLGVAGNQQCACYSQRGWYMPIDGSAFKGFGSGGDTQTAAEFTGVDRLTNGIMLGWLRG